MAKFSGGTVNKDGVLSYVYEAKPGGRKNNINIKNINGEWFFVNKDGKVRDTLANKGKLSKTHIDNLKGAPGSSEENIFASANVSPETGKVATTVDTSGGIDTTPQNNLSGPIPQQNTLANSDYSLSQAQGVRPAPQISDLKNAASSDPASLTPTRTNASSSFDSMANPGSRTWEGTGQMRLNTDPNSVPSNTTAAPPQSLSGQNEFTGFGQENMSGPGWGAPSTPIAQGGMGAQSEWAAKGFASEPKYHQEGSAIDHRQFTSGSVSPAVDARLEAATADTTTPGITNNTDSSWGAADWNAVGSVMKGVGGLASAYTGIKNYQLARDAYNTQKNQWQQDYDQRLKAFEQNRKLANQDIQSRNRTLLARNKDRTDTYSELKA